MSAPTVPLAEVEWRVDSEPYERDGNTTCRFVPYVDAAIVARMLDEWVGPENWSDTYEPGEVAGKWVLWCRLSVRVKDEWVSKSDVGKPSQMESEKGAVSDAFKRAAVLKWGVGRNVYELPTLYAHCRTFTGGGKVKAAADGKRTLDDLLRQLKVAGFDADGGKVSDGEPVEADEPSGEDHAAAARAPRSGPVCALCGESLAGSAVAIVEGKKTHRDGCPTGEAA